MIPDYESTRGFFATALCVLRHGEVRSNLFSFVMPNLFQHPTIPNANTISTKIISKLALTIMRLFIYIAFFCLIASCKTTWQTGKNQLHYLSLESSMDYTDEKIKTIKNLETTIDTFAYFYMFRTNCEFFPEYFIDDNFAWEKGGKQVKKTLKKDTEAEFYKSKTKTVNCKELFDFFVSARIDTVKTLPIQNKKNIFIDGYIDDYYPLQCLLKIKCGNYSYSKFIDPRLLYKPEDTLHPIYIFVKKLKAL